MTPTMKTAADLHRAALDPLTPLPMTPVEVADFLARCHANTNPGIVHVGRLNRDRNERRRAALGR